MGYDEQVQDGSEVDQHHQTAVCKSQQCSTCARHSGRLPPLTDLVQHLPWMHNGRCPWRTPWHVSIGGRIITNLRVADVIEGLAGEEQELANLVNRLDKTSYRYGMEISAIKTKLMTNREDDHSQRTGTRNCGSVQVPWSCSQWRGLIDQSPSKSGADSSSTGKTETNMERQKHQSINQTEAATCIGPVDLFICMQDMDTNSRTAEKIPSSGMRCLRRVLGIS